MSKLKVRATSATADETKAEVIDYKDKKVVIDFSYPFLNHFIRFGEFSNLFATPYEYIEYTTFINTIFFPTLSDKNLKEIIMPNHHGSEHNHLVTGDELKYFQKVIHAVLLNTKSYNGLSAEEFISQNINDADIWQISFTNDFGRVFGIFVENIFKPILYDPHHLVYKAKIGSRRKYSNAKTNKFNPLHLANFTYVEKCIYCGGEEQLHGVDDRIIRSKVFICDSCLLRMIDDNL